MIPFNLNAECSFLHQIALKERRDYMVTLLRQRILEEVVQNSPCERKIYQIIKTTIESIEFNDVPSEKEKKFIFFRIWTGMISMLELGFPMLEYFPNDDPGHSVGLKYQSLYDDETLELQVQRKADHQAKLKAADKIGYLVASLNMFVVMSKQHLSPIFLERMGYDEKTEKMFGHLIEEMGEALDLDTTYVHYSLVEFFQQKPLEHWLTAVERRAADIIAEELKIPLSNKHIEYFPVFGLSTQQDLDLMILYLKSCPTDLDPTTISKIETRCQVLIRPLR